MAWPAAAIAAVGAFAGAQANNMWNWTMNKKAAKTAFNRQRELYMLDYRLHTPSNQMKLLKEASLNPNLVYGEGNAGSVVTHMPSVDSAQAPKTESAASAAFQGLQLYQDMKLKDANIRSAEQQMKESKSREALNQSRQQKSDLETRILRDRGVPANASASTSLFRKAADWLSEAGSSAKKYIHQAALDAIDRKRGRAMDDRYEKWKQSRRPSMPPYSAVDRTLFDYLYEYPDNSRIYNRGKDYDRIRSYYRFPGQYW